MDERRYDDDEVAAIFKTATEGHSNLPAREAPRDDGLTLADLQEIGKEIGLAPETVAQAAHALDVRGSAPAAPAAARTVMGLPFGVGRTVNLGRRMSDEEWEQLVVRLREVFQARGRMRAEGSLRSWTNGNLQVLLEPTADGHRVRMSTMNGTARAYIGMGVMMFVFAGITALAGSFEAAAGTGRTMMLLVLGGSGLAAFGALRLPGWARLRKQQMEMLASELGSRPALQNPEE